MDDYLSKPFRRERLLAAIEPWSLQRHRRSLHPRDAREMQPPEGAPQGCWPAPRQTLSAPESVAESAS